MTRSKLQVIAQGIFFCVLTLLWAVAARSHEALPESSGASGENLIAFTSSLSGSWQIWALDPDSGNTTRLTRDAEEFFYPAWSPDGRILACADGNGDIRLVHKNGRLESLSGLPPGCTHPAWSPDGERIALVCNTVDNRKEDSELWLTELKSGGVRKLTEQSGIQKYPNWSPDGLSLVYTTGFRVSPVKVVEDLWLINSDGSHPRPLISNNSSNIQPCWSPDGNRIAFASDLSGNMDIWVVDKDGKNPRQLTHERSYEGDPSWSPDGKRICFSSTLSGSMQIWVMDSSGANPRQLTGLVDPRSEGREPAWSR